MLCGQTPVVLADPAPCQGADTQVMPPPCEEQLYSFHTVHLKEKKAQQKAKLKIYTSPNDEIIYV